jgi:hypothetical protein
MVVEGHDFSRADCNPIMLGFSSWGSTSGTCEATYEIGLSRLESQTI